MADATAEMPDYNQSRQSTLIGCLVFFLLIGNFSLVAKLLVQLRSRPRFLVEDYFLVIALASADTVCASYMTAVHYGLGLHMTRIVAEDPNLPHQLIHVYYYIWLPAVFNAPVFAGIKFALLFLYRRLFLVNQKWLKIAWWTNFVYLTLWFFGSFFYYIFACDPPSYYWNRLYATFHVTPPHPVSGHCVRTTVVEGELTLIFAVIQDVALLFLPMTTLAKLQMSTGKKIGLMSLFGLGLIACILEVARIVDLSIRSGISGWSKLTDPTWEICDFVIMTCCVEMIGILCACFPVIAPRGLQGYQELKTAFSTSELPSAIKRLIGRPDNKSSESTERLPSKPVEIGKVGRASSAIVVRNEFEVHSAPKVESSWP